MSINSLLNFLLSFFSFALVCPTFLFDFSFLTFSLAPGNGEATPAAAGGDASGVTPKMSNSKKKARVLYDYDAKDPNELSLLADEIITVISESENDYVVAERGSKRGKVPSIYLEILE